MEDLDRAGGPVGPGRFKSKSGGAWDACLNGYDDGYMVGNEARDRRD